MFLSRPYTHLCYIVFIHGLLEHHVLMVTSWGNTTKQSVRVVSMFASFPLKSADASAKQNHSCLLKNYLLGCIRPTEEGS